MTRDYKAEAQAIGIPINDEVMNHKDGEVGVFDPDLRSAALEGVAAYLREEQKSP
jgi:hypothetical protein